MLLGFLFPITPALSRIKAKVQALGPLQHWLYASVYTNAHNNATIIINNTASNSSNSSSCYNTG